MPNRHRGEIEAEIGGVTRRLVLTLGALAELEDAVVSKDITATADSRTVAKGMVPVAKGAQQGSAGGIAAAGAAAAQQAHSNGVSPSVVAWIVVATILAGFAVFMFWHWRQQQQQEKAA